MAVSTPDDAASEDPAARWLGEIWAALDGPRAALSRVDWRGAGELPSVFRVSDLAAAAVGAAGLGLADLMEAQDGRPRSVAVDRRLASFWFGVALRPEGWSLPPPWDAVAGDYATADGFIRLHTNAPHHRRAALAVLDCAESRAAVAQAVALWQADALEARIVAAGGCAAALRSVAAWAEHPQGRAVAAEPLVHWRPAQARTPARPRPFSPGRPLAGLRVLDLTRVLAGPTATRFLAGFGAQVLRLDPPDWDEPAVVPDVTAGKACARLDMKTAAGRDAFTALLAGADVLVHGYRDGALDALGFDAERRHAIRPGLVDVSLTAYGWTGPWRGRRGFDSLVQMSSGIAEAGRIGFKRAVPTPLPVQALDHATGYLLAAAALRGLALRHTLGTGVTARASLARTAALLTSVPAAAPGEGFAPEQPGDLAPGVEATDWGPARRLAAPIAIPGTPMAFERPACALGTSAPAWS